MTAATLSPVRLHTSIARRLAYPSVLLANAGLVGWALATEASLEAVTFGGLLASLLAFFALERLVPHRRDWHPGARETLRDLLYFGMNGGIDAAIKMGLAFGVATLGVWDNGLPFALALPLAVLAVDFVGYWLHRWGHHGWLWKVHGVHHTPDKVNTWNNNTIHFLNTIYSGLSKALPLWLLGFDPEVVVVATYIATLWSFAVHANVATELGVLDRVLMSPVHHRLHHSTNLDEAGNFATVCTLWDRLFGTFVHGPDLEPAEVGVVAPLAFPRPDDVLRNQLHPFIDQGRA